MALIDNCVRYFKCNENAANPSVVDATGTNNALASVNTSNFAIAGHIDGAFEYNGTDEYVNSNYQIANIASAKSFNFWLKTSEAGADHLFSCYDGNDYVYIFLNRAANSLSYALYDGTNSNEQYMTDASINGGSWVMITVTQSSGAPEGIKIYLNGSEEALTSHQGGTVNGNAMSRNQFIAARNNQGVVGGFVDADISDFGIWEKTLTSDEVTALWNSGAGFEYPFNYTLTTSVNPVGTGSISGAGDYTHGTNVDVKATLNDPYSFTEWTGDLSGSVNPTTILMDDNKSITANFISHATTLGTKELRTDWPCVTGLGADDKHAGRQINLVAEKGSLVSPSEKVGL